MDDDVRLRRRRLQGVPVLGTTGELAAVLERTKPDVVLVTIPDAHRALLDEIVDICGDADVSCRFVRREVDLDPRVVLGSASE